MNYLRYLSVPYEYYGRTLEGLDCYGIVLLMYKEQFNIELKEFPSVYPHKAWGPEDSKFVKFLEEHVGFEKVPCPLVGDLLVLADARGIINHCGIVLNDFEFIHATEGDGVVISNYLYSGYSKRTRGFYRYPKSNDI